MDATHFATAAEWRAWLAEHHHTAPELWVGFHKKASGRPSLTWPEAVDQALCFGWIDGIRKSVDESRYARPAPGPSRASTPTNSARGPGCPSRWRPLLRKDGGRGPG